MRTLQIPTRVWAGAWIIAAALALLAINVGDHGGDAFTSLWPPWHPYWFNALSGLCLFVVLAVGTPVVRLYGQASHVGRALLLLMGGLVMWSIGDFIWFWFNTCDQWIAALDCASGSEAPYPSVADVAYLAQVPFYAAAFLTLAKLTTTTARDVARLWWIPLLLALGTAYMAVPPTDLGAFSFGRGTLLDAEASGRELSVSILYLVAHVTIISMAFILLVRSRLTAGGMLYAPLLLVSASLVAFFAADMVFDYRDMQGTYFNGDAADVLYTVARALLLVALLRFGVEHQRLRNRIAAPPIAPGAPAPAPAPATVEVD